MAIILVRTEFNSITMVKKSKKTVKYCQLRSQRAAVKKSQCFLFGQLTLSLVMVINTETGCCGHHGHCGQSLVSVEQCGHLSSCYSGHYFMSCEEMC